MTANLRINVLANFFGNAWIGLLSLGVVPIYIKLVGYGGYGIIGFYATLQILVFLLDFGLSATINREMARFSSAELPQAGLRDLARTIEFTYWGIGLLIAITIGVTAQTIATHWLMSKDLSPVKLQQIALLMGIAISLRWPFALYSAGLIGLQKQILQNLISVSVETLRIAGSIAVLVMGYGLAIFFVWQAVASLLGSLYISQAFWKIASMDGYRGKIDFYQLKRVSRFAGGMSGIGILVTILVQTDKVVLSKMLTLGEFGQYIAAGTLASGLYLVSKPIFTAHYPELTRLAAGDNHAAESAMYQHGYQLMASLVAPLAAVLMIFSKEIIKIWIGGNALTDDLYKVLALLVLGTALNALMNIPYALQLAHGWTSLTFKSNLVAVIVLVPIIVVLTKIFGMNGAAFAWVILNSGYIIVLIPIMSWYGLTKGGCWPFYRDALVYPFAISLSTVGLAKIIMGVIGFESTCGIAVTALAGLISGIILSMLVLNETRPMMLRVAKYIKNIF